MAAKTYTPAELAVRNKTQSYRRLIGTAVAEGADTAALEAYLATVGCIDPPGLIASVVSKSPAPKLGELELRQLGGLDGVRALFGLSPVSTALAVVPDTGFVLHNGRVDPRVQANIRHALAQETIRLSYDAFHAQVFVEEETESGRWVGRVLDDAAINRLWLGLDERYQFRPSLEFFTIVLHDLARQHTYHPVVDYLRDLSWDGVERLDTWLVNYAGVSDSAYTRAVGALPLVAAVRRVTHWQDPTGVKFDELLTLVGLQGTDKSKLVRMLCPEPTWFSDSMNLGAEPKVVIENSRGVWIAEIPELQGMSTRDITIIKAQLSRQVDGPVRLAYGRTPERVVRQFVYFGTVNGERFLKDTTGNRRMWPVLVGQVNVGGLRAIRDQLWAEAVVRERTTQSLHLPRSLWPLATAAQMEALVEDPWEDLLDQHLDLMMPVVLVGSTWIAVGLGEDQKAKRDNRQSDRISAIMERHGYHKKTVTLNGKKVRAWVNDLNLTTVQPSQVSECGGDLPF